jgi:hypothetical protein
MRDVDERIAALTQAPRNIEQMPAFRKLRDVVGSSRISIVDAPATLFATSTSCRCPSESVSTS